MAYKDEYEVARLLTGKSFKQSIETQFGQGLRLTYHLAPPALGANAATHKRAFGYWMRIPMMILGRLQWLRETFLDPFALQQERQREQAWRDRYIAFVKDMSAAPERYDLSVAKQIAELPADVRGFGHIKMQAMDTAIQRWDELSLSLRKADENKE
jgi:indolepyruvate ferredoxin oxidoreductase